MQRVPEHFEPDRRSSRQPDQRPYDQPQRLISSHTSLHSFEHSCLHGSQQQNHCAHCRNPTSNVRNSLESNNNGLEMTNDGPIIGLVDGNTTGNTWNHNDIHSNVDTTSMLIFNSLNRPLPSLPSIMPSRTLLVDSLDNIPQSPYSPLQNASPSMLLPFNSTNQNSQLNPPTYNTDPPLINSLYMNSNNSLLDLSEINLNEKSVSKKEYDDINTNYSENFSKLEISFKAHSYAPNYIFGFPGMNGWSVSGNIVLRNVTNNDILIDDLKIIFIGKTETRIKSSNNFESSHKMQKNADSGLTFNKSVDINDVDSKIEYTEPYTPKSPLPTYGDSINSNQKEEDKYYSDSNLHICESTTLIENGVPSFLINTSERLRIMPNEGKTICFSIDFPSNNFDSLVGFINGTNPNAFENGSFKPLMDLPDPCKVVNGTESCSMKTHYFLTSKINFTEIIKASSIKNVDTSHESLTKSFTNFLNKRTTVNKGKSSSSPDLAPAAESPISEKQPNFVGRIVRQFSVNRGIEQYNTSKSISDSYSAEETLEGNIESRASSPNRGISSSAKGIIRRLSSIRRLEAEQTPISSSSEPSEQYISVSTNNLHENSSIHSLPSQGILSRAFSLKNKKEKTVVDGGKSFSPFTKSVKYVHFHHKIKASQQLRFLWFRPSVIEQLIRNEVPPSMTWFGKIRGDNNNNQNESKNDSNVLFNYIVTLDSNVLEPGRSFTLRFRCTPTLNVFNKSLINESLTTVTSETFNPVNNASIGITKSIITAPIISKKKTEEPALSPLFERRQKGKAIPPINTNKLNSWDEVLQLTAKSESSPNNDFTGFEKVFRSEDSINPHDFNTDEILKGLAECNVDRNSISLNTPTLHKRMANNSPSQEDNLIEDNDNLESSGTLDTNKYPAAHLHSQDPGRVCDNKIRLRMQQEENTSKTKVQGKIGTVHPECNDISSKTAEEMIQSISKNSARGGSEGYSTGSQQNSYPKDLISLSSMIRIRKLTLSVRENVLIKSKQHTKLLQRRIVDWHYTAPQNDPNFYHFRLDNIDARVFHIKLSSRANTSGDRGLTNLYHTCRISVELETAFNNRMQVVLVECPVNIMYWGFTRSERLLERIARGRMDVDQVICVEPLPLYQEDTKNDTETLTTDSPNEDMENLSQSRTDSKTNDEASINAHKESSIQSNASVNNINSDDSVSRKKNKSDKEINNEDREKEKDANTKLNSNNTELANDYVSMMTSDEVRRATGDGDDSCFDVFYHKNQTFHDISRINSENDIDGADNVMYSQSVREPIRNGLYYDGDDDVSLARLRRLSRQTTRRSSEPFRLGDTNLMDSPRSSIYNGNEGNPTTNASRISLTNSANHSSLEIIRENDVRNSSKGNTTHSAGSNNHRVSTSLDDSLVSSNSINRGNIAMILSSTSQNITLLENTSPVDDSIECLTDVEHITNENNFSTESNYVPKYDITSIRPTNTTSGPIRNSDSNSDIGEGVFLDEFIANTTITQRSPTVNSSLLDFEDEQ